MQVFQVYVNGHGWLLRAGSLKAAAKAGLDIYAKRFPKALSITRLRETNGRGGEFSINVRLGSEAELALATSEGRA